MSLSLSKKIAEKLLRDAAALAEKGNLDIKWVKKIEIFSKLCEEGNSKTHIAFFGTAILAKAIDQRADLFAIKPDHAKDNPYAFSARSLCHTILVPLSAELGFSLGVTGREPLNNQPYFRMTKLNDGTPIHTSGRLAFNYMLELVNEINQIQDKSIIKKALAAFIFIRRKYQKQYASYQKGTLFTPEDLIISIKKFVSANSEGGKRSQAVVAGLLDTYCGEKRVESGRINDPSKKYPGDVCIKLISNEDVWEKAFEVRDKPVNMNDVQIFGKKCIDMGVGEAAIVMTSEKQKELDSEELKKWSDKFGIEITLFQGWDSFVQQILFWSGEAKKIAAAIACENIYRRLVLVEASQEAFELWKSLTKKEGI